MSLAQLMCNRNKKFHYRDDYSSSNMLIKLLHFINDISLVFFYNRTDMQYLFL